MRQKLDLLATVQEERAFEMPFPPHGEPRRFPGVVAATAAVIRWRCEQLGLWREGEGAATPVIDALFSREEPQTGPNGTLMGFSADYYLVGGSQAAAAGNSKFLWVIEGNARQQVAWPIERLEEKGNLMLLKDGWRPESGPYRSFVVEQFSDGSRQVISNVAEMR